MFGDRIKIMWEKQLVDPPIHYNKAKLSRECPPFKKELFSRNNFQKTNLFNFSFFLIQAHSSKFGGGGDHRRS